MGNELIGLGVIGCILTVIGFGIAYYIGSKGNKPKKELTSVEKSLEELRKLWYTIQLKVANNGWCTTSGRPEMSILGHPRKIKYAKIVDFTHFFYAWQKQRFMLILMNKLIK